MQASEEGVGSSATTGRPRGHLDIGDLYPKLHELRERHAVGEVSLFDELGLPRQAQFQEVREYTAFTYEACREILADQKRFSVEANAAKYVLMHGDRTIAVMDDPEHKRYRALVSAGFYSKGLEEWSGHLVPEIVHSQIDRIADMAGGPIDFVEHFTFPIPIQIIVGVLGVPREDWPQLLEWVGALVRISELPQEGLAASQAANAYLAEIVNERRSAPRNDLASTLTQAEVDGERLNDSMITAFLVLLLAAGGETTVRNIGTLLSALLANPDQFELLKQDRSLLGQAIDEALRWDPPLGLTQRQCLVDTEVAGTPIPAGSNVVAHIGAANRDPARWPDPDRFDIRREPQPDLTFGLGPHYCLGTHLARKEIETALNAVLDRFEGLRLAPGAEIPVVRGVILRGPSTLPVTFDAVHPA